jgi:putative FmdB family regulatory protein
MPIYEFKCKDCGKVFSKLVFNNANKVECPDCKSENVDKLISSIAGISGASGSFSSCGGSSGFT